MHLTFYNIELQEHGIGIVFWRGIRRALVELSRLALLVFVVAAVLTRLTEKLCLFGKSLPSDLSLTIEQPASSSSPDRNCTVPG